MVREVFDSFEIVGPNGNYKCLLYYRLLGLNSTEFLRILPQNRIPTDLVQRSHNFG